MKIRNAVNPVILEFNLDEVRTLLNAMYLYHDAVIKQTTLPKKELERRMLVIGELIILLDLLV